MDAHDPYDPPPAFRPRPPPAVRPAVASGKVGQLAHGVNWRGAPLLSHAEIGYLRQLYDGGVRYWDAELATLVAGLAAEGILDSTVLVITADHGEAFQEHAKLKHGMHLYDELLHVPLVIVGPGIGAGRAGGQAQGIDILPTVAALLGLTVPPDLPGQNLLAAHEERPAYSATRWGILPSGAGAELVSLRTLGWKLIEAPATGHAELYDLAADPTERRNLYGREEGDALAAVLARVRATAPPPPHATGHDPRLRDKLRALGYIE